MSVRPPFDPELASALQDRRDEVVTSLTADEIPALRRRSMAPGVLAAAADGAFTTSTHEAPGAHGAPDVSLLLLRPIRLSGAVPCLVHLHGGGLVAGSRYDDVVPLLGLAAQVGCAVASVEYRLAPEDPYPAALEDAYAALGWVAANSARLGIDPDRIVVEGISAGGGLAAALALLARDRGGPTLAGQMLLCPMLDDRNDTPSAHQMAGAGSWDRGANETAWRAYLGDAAGGPEVRGHAAPARETDLTGLPPAFIDVGSAETFRDEAVGYATRLWLGGGTAELHVWPGGFHGFDYLVPEAAVSVDARDARRRWLVRVLGLQATGRAAGESPDSS